MRKIVIGVMGPGTGASETDRQNAYTLGMLIAQEGWVLLTGGKNVGVMDAASRGAKAANGLIVGILPDDCDSEALLRSRSVSQRSADRIWHARGCDRFLTHLDSTSTTQPTQLTDRNSAGVSSRSPIAQNSVTTEQPAPQSHNGLCSN